MSRGASGTEFGKTPSDRRLPSAAAAVRNEFGAKIFHSAPVPDDFARARNEFAGAQNDSVAAQNDFARAQDENARGAE